MMKSKLKCAVIKYPAYEIGRWGKRYLINFGVNCLCIIFRILQALDHKIFCMWMILHPSRVCSWQHRLSFVKTELFTLYRHAI
jgi:hypothetical protein